MSTSCAATTTASSANSRPSPRNSGCRARPSAASSTGWSAAIMPTRPRRPRQSALRQPIWRCFAGLPPRLPARSAALACRRHAQPRLAGLPRPAIRPAHPRARARPLVDAGCLTGLDRLSDRQQCRRHPGPSISRTARNWAIFTHNIFNITDKLEPDARPALHPREQDARRANFNNDNTACPAQQARSSAPSLANPATPAARGARHGPGRPDLPGQFVGRAQRRSINDKRSEGEWTGTGVLSFKPTDRLLIYASYSRGYKAGGFNLDRSALGRRSCRGHVGRRTGASQPPVRSGDVNA